MRTETVLNFGSADCRTSDQEERRKTAAPSAVSADATIENVLSRSLFEPLEDFLRRPSKSLRTQLVELGFLLSGESQERKLDDREDQRDRTVREFLARTLESIHAGSLVIDDIQDGSKERRGSPALHEIYGMPLALNAGNWLYFRPFGSIQDLNLDEKTELLLYRLYHETMFNAHMGQAIDLGTKIDEVDPAHVPKLCMSSIRLKTGALTSLAVCFGAVTGSASEARLASLREFGMEFGVALQMFDDIGNLCAAPGLAKRHEDLSLRRPTWIWAAAAEELSPADYRSFVEAVRRLPDETPLNEWLRATDLAQRARTRAESFLTDSVRVLSERIGDTRSFPRALQLIQELSERIRVSYG